MFASVARLCSGVTVLPESVSAMVASTSATTASGSTERGSTTGVGSDGVPETVADGEGSVATAGDLAAREAVAEAFPATSNEYVTASPTVFSDAARARTATRRGDGGSGEARRRIGARRRADAETGGARRGAPDATPAASRAGSGSAAPANADIFATTGAECAARGGMIARRLVFGMTLGKGVSASLCACQSIRTVGRTGRKTASFFET
jgi:hypothetical protein